jgi:flavin-dependent dehydrogenase
MAESYDVAIIGGGPAGSTVASTLKTYSPELRVAVFEREIFPREHIGESLLPTVGKVLDEIGAWNKIEAAGFPIKVGATYRWGSTDDLWDFNLLETAEIDPNAARPGVYDGWRRRAAFQVERAEFDEILLDHAQELGAHVFEGVGVRQVHAQNGRVEALQLEDGTRVEAKHYVDASGNAGLLRRQLGVEVEEPNALKNIAIWDYWEDAEWAVTIGTVATRVQVMSLGYGWIWFIPISATRTSVGLVCPAEYYRKSGETTQALYDRALQAEPRVAALLKKAQPTGKVQATKDWSFCASQMVGDNWFLVGESAGFADPILAAGLSMTMIGAKECAYTILELEKGKLEADWLKTAFATRQNQRITQHIKFANFWYTANGYFTDLMDYTAEIAREAGLSMNAESAWQWLGTGGFISLETAGAGLAGHSVEQIKNLQQMMLNEESDWLITKYNVFDLNIEGVVPDRTPVYDQGRIHVARVLKKGDLELPVLGGIRLALEILQTETRLGPIIGRIREISRSHGPVIALNVIEAFEVLLKDGWITGMYSPDEPLLRSEDIPRTPNVDWNKDTFDPMVKLAEAFEA